MAVRPLLVTLNSTKTFITRQHRLAYQVRIFLRVDYVKIAVTVCDHVFFPIPKRNFAEIRDEHGPLNILQLAVRLQKLRSRQVLVVQLQEMAIIEAEPIAIICSYCTKRTQVYMLNFATSFSNN